MKKSTRLLVVILSLCLLAMPVLAAAKTVSAELTYRDIKILVDGEEVTPTDVNGESTEPFIYNDSTYLPVRAISEALGIEVDWDDATSSVYLTTADALKSTEEMKSILAIGFVDADGSKIKAIAVEYAEELNAASVDVEDFVVSDYGTVSNPACELGSDPGKALKAYVNDAAEVSETGGTKTGKYVIIEVNTDYQLSGVPTYELSMIAGVKQVGAVETSDGKIIAPYGDGISNYTMSQYEEMTPMGDVRVKTKAEVEAGTYYIDNIAAFKLFTKEDGTAFHATNCFEEATGEYVDIDLPYALFIPEDYNPNGSYGLVLQIHDAGFMGDDPMITLCESQAAANFASDEVQAMAKANGMDGLFVLCPQIEDSIRTTRDNYTISAGVPATWQLLDYLTEEYSIDMDRIFGTGQSMGGMQVIAMASQRDNYFAGIWEHGCQWGNNYNKEELYPDRSGSASFYESHDETIWTKDADGNDSDFGRNWFYLISDDNLLISNCKGDAFSTTVWKELKYLYHDIAGVEIPYTDFKPLEDSIDDQNQAIRDLLKVENGNFNFYWYAYEGGSHMLTWVYGHKLMAGYEWLVSQTRESEQAREKLDALNRPWAVETDEAKIAAKQTEDRALQNGFYFAVPAEGAGTIGYNSGWFSMGDKIVDDIHFPGWIATAK